MAYELLPLQAFRDNYIWMLTGADAVVVVDPGDAEPVRRALAGRRRRLAAILLTHHHADHVGGAASLAWETGCPVYGPAGEPIPAVTRPLREGDRVGIEALDMHFQVLEIPGHTAGHIAYTGPDIVFCGDTLFSAGCGRLFEGTPRQMSASLAKLAALADSTAVCCGHEYTLTNLRFARTVEPGNGDIVEYFEEATARRARGESTLPAMLGRERRVNPFLRCREPGVMAAAAQQAGRTLTDPVEVFSVIRDWKDKFT